MIDAEFRSEERFSRLALGYSLEDEKIAVKKEVEKFTKESSLTPEIYTTKVSSGKEVLIIEYHDDSHREAGPIFDNIMKALNSKECI